MQETDVTKVEVTKEHPTTETEVTETTKRTVVETESESEVTKEVSRLFQL